MRDALKQCPWKRDSSFSDGLLLDVGVGVRASQADAIHAGVFGMGVRREGMLRGVGCVFGGRGDRLEERLSFLVPS